MKSSAGNGSPNYAGFWVRLGSLSLDGIVLLPIPLLYFSILGVIHPALSTGAYLKLGFFFLLGFAVAVMVVYFSWFNAAGRQTLGKKLFGLQITDGAGKPIPLRQSFGRALAYFADTVILGVGHLFIPFNRKKRALHDMLAKTYVLRIQQRRRFEPLLIVMALLGSGICSLWIAGTIRSSYLQTFRISTGAQKPTILTGDFIMVDKLWARKQTPERGDIIVFKYPVDPRLDYVKRCVALPGERVEIRAGTVWVNGTEESLELLTQDYDSEEGQHVLEYLARWPNGRSYRIRHYAGHDRTTENHGPIVVPEDSYFEMGDNRENSSDSRYWGFVPQQNIMGKAGIVYWSWDRQVPLSDWIKKVRWSRIGEVLQ